MRISGKKAGLLALSVVLVIGLVVWVALPWLASTQIVRDRIAYELSLMSGYRVQISQAPEIGIWPSVTATLNEVSLHDWSDRDGQAVLEAEIVEIELAALAALRGDIVFKEISLVRPLMRLSEPGQVLDMPPTPGGGTIYQAVESARIVVSDNPEQPDVAALPSDPFGTVEFSEGRIMRSGRAGDTEAVTSIGGRLTWPSVNRPATLSATGIWRGEGFTLEASSGQPLILLANGNAPVDFAIESALAKVAFSGHADLSDEFLFNGTASLESPSFRRMLEWSQTDIAPGAAIGAVAINGTVLAKAGRIQIDDVNLNIGSNSGSGALEAVLDQTPPLISGTLDFSTLDLGSFLAAFSALGSVEATMANSIDTSFADQVGLDLRLSASNAALGDIAMERVAATTQIRKGLVAFDISDAAIFGGNLQAGIRIDQTDAGQLVEMRLLADQIDLSAAGREIGLTRFIPQGRGDVSIILQGPGEDWQSVVRRGEGSFAFTMGPGTVSGFTRQEFEERWDQGEFFSLIDLEQGVLSTRGAEFRAQLRNGIARIDQASVLLDNEVVSLTGMVPFASRALALSGSLNEMETDGTVRENRMNFFIGGAWDSPFVAPSLTME